MGLPAEVAKECQVSGVSLKVLAKIAFGIKGGGW